MKAKIVLTALASAALLFAATAQAATSTDDGYPVVPRPTSGVFTHRVSAVPRLASVVDTPRLSVQLGGQRQQDQYSWPFLDNVVSGISGWSLTTVLEDDPVAWAYNYGMNDNVGGFVCITAVDPSDWCDRRVFMGPTPTITFLNWFNYDQMPTYWDAAVAIMVATHEANHYKLFSADEGRVNACALQQFPSVISDYFGFSPTTTKTVPVRKVVWKKKWVWVRKHGKRVRVRKRVRRVVIRYVDKTVPNPDYTNLVAAAEESYRLQPPPYNTGTCY